MSNDKLSALEGHTLSELSMEDLCSLSPSKGAFWRGFAESESSWKKGSVPKKDGSRRPIFEPSSWGKLMGSAIASAISQDGGPGFEWGFQPGTGAPAALAILDEYRMEGHRLLSIDIKGAFEAVSSRQAYQALRDAGASKDVARVGVRAGCHQGKLRMGGVVSPAIFSLVFEKGINEILRQLPYVISAVAYADDLTIAVEDDAPKTRVILRHLRRVLWQVLRFRLCSRKSVSINPRGPMTALGTTELQGERRPARKHQKTIRALTHLVNTGRSADTYRRGLAKAKPARKRHYATTVADALQGYAAWARGLPLLSPVDFDPTTIRLNLLNRRGWFDPLIENDFR